MLVPPAGLAGSGFLVLAGSVSADSPSEFFKGDSSEFVFPADPAVLLVVRPLAVLSVLSVSSLELVSESVSGALPFEHAKYSFLHFVSVPPSLLQL